jgi:hypothetical protein
VRVGWMSVGSDDEQGSEIRDAVPERSLSAHSGRSG